MASSLNWFDEVRPKLVIVIFGPYYPPSAKDVLTRLKEGLRATGYVKTYLVEDQTEPLPSENENVDSYFLRKSRYWVERCDVGFMVFVRKSDNQGVTSELDHLCNNAKDRMWRYMVLFDSKARISSLVRGQFIGLERRLDRGDFGSENQLYGLALGKLPECLRILYYELRNRPT